MKGLRNQCSLVTKNTFEDKYKMSLLKEFDSWAFGTPAPISVTNRWQNWMFRHEGLLSFKDETEFLNNYDQMMLIFLRETRVQTEGSK